MTYETPIQGHGEAMQRDLLTLVDRITDHAEASRRLGALLNLIEGAMPKDDHIILGSFQAADEMAFLLRKDLQNTVELVDALRHRPAAAVAVPAKAPAAPSDPTDIGDDVSMRASRIETLVKAMDALRTKTMTEAWEHFSNLLDQAAPLVEGLGSAAESVNRALYARA